MIGLLILSYIIGFSMGVVGGAVWHGMISERQEADEAAEQAILERELQRKRKERGAERGKDARH